MNRLKADIKCPFKHATLIANKYHVHNYYNFIEMVTENREFKAGIKFYTTSCVLVFTLAFT